ncbi:hypothetical protein DFH06DRAFT_1374424 [Mycena polygramma]|nr:hypothetical protein DFH06DRAFT_1374424 [Mycena polygramma]
MHKPDCRENSEAMNVAKLLGPEYFVRLPALKSWAEHFGRRIGGAASSALDILKHHERIADTIVIFFLDFLEVLPLEDLPRKPCVDPKLLAEFLRLNTPRLDRIRILLVDVRFPWPYPLDFAVPPRAIFDHWKHSRISHACKRSPPLPDAVSGATKTTQRIECAPSQLIPATGHRPKLEYRSSSRGPRANSIPDVAANVVAGEMAHKNGGLTSAAA